jgi:ribosomal protein L7/L12
MSLDDRLMRLERKVDYLFQRMGVDPSAAFAFDEGTDVGAGLPESFHEALARGKTIEAIKIYHDATGVGLKEAKRAVESMTGR